MTQDYEEGYFTLDNGQRMRYERRGAWVYVKGVPFMDPEEFNSKYPATPFPKGTSMNHLIRKLEDLKVEIDAELEGHRYFIETHAAEATEGERDKAVDKANEVERCVDQVEDSLEALLAAMQELDDTIPELA